LNGKRSPVGVLRGHDGTRGAGVRSPLNNKRSEGEEETSGAPQTPKQIVRTPMHSKKAKTTAGEPTETQGRGPWGGRIATDKIEKKAAVDSSILFREKGVNKRRTQGRATTSKARSKTKKTKKRKTQDSYGGLLYIRVGKELKDGKDFRYRS